MGGGLNGRYTSCDLSISDVPIRIVSAYALSKILRYPKWVALRSQGVTHASSEAGLRIIPGGTHHQGLQLIDGVYRDAVYDSDVLSHPTDRLRSTEDDSREKTHTSRTCNIALCLMCVFFSLLSRFVTPEKLRVSSKTANAANRGRRLKIRDINGQD